MRPIYLDNCATTRIDPQVLSEMIPYFDHEYGNAASRSHAFGWAAEEAVETARGEIAGLIAAAPREIVLTSGATESNNLAIAGFARANRAKGNHIITCVTEHKSVLDTCQQLEEEGFRVTYLPVDRLGRISLDQLREAITDETLLVSLMLANNETGTLHPIREISQICRQHSVALHVDATQAMGKMPISVRDLGADLISFSAHKMHGPKGIGALYVRRASRLKIEPLIRGGGHQGGLRSGTLPVPLIVGFGTACRLASQRLGEEQQRLEELRDRLEQGILRQLPDTIVNGDRQHRSPVVTNLSFPGVDGEALLVQLDAVAASAGSACTSASSKPSYVLAAMGVSDALASATLRLSVSRMTTESEIEQALEAITSLVGRLQDKPAATATA